MSFHQFIRDTEGWQTARSEARFSNPHLQVVIAEVRTPTRSTPCPWTIVHRKGAVVIAPVTASGDFLLIRQERIPVKTTLWEFPAGQIDESAEHNEQTIRAAAARELREETGHELASGGELIAVGYYFTSPGFTDEHCHLFVARPVVPSDQGHAYDENEAITECRAFSPAQLRAMIAANEIRDANTLAAFARMSALGIV
jgi:ADP-ribose diphosphatase